MRLPSKLEFGCPVKITYGKRAIEHLPYELSTRNARKPLLLQDEDACRENRTQALVDALRDSPMIVGTVESLPAEVDLEIVHQLASIYRDRDHDALLVLGSGSIVDLAKLLNLVVSTGQDDPGVFSGTTGIEQRLKPMALIASAGASGYEASGSMQTGLFDLRSSHLMPDLVVIDERTVGDPGLDAIIAAGITALAFGAEAMLASDNNPMVEIYAANAMQMAVAALVETNDQPPEAIAPRLHAASAAVMAGCTLADKTPGYMHQLGRHLANTGRISIAGAMGVLLPVAMDYGARNWGWMPSDLLAALIGLDRSASTPSRQRSMRVTAKLAALVNDLFNLTAGRIPRTLRDAGFEKNDLRIIAEAFTDPAGGVDHDAASVILECALDGGGDA